MIDFVIDFRDSVRVDLINQDETLIRVSRTICRQHAAGWDESELIIGLLFAAMNWWKSAVSWIFSH